MQGPIAGLHPLPRYCRPAKSSFLLTYFRHFTSFKVWTPKQRQLLSFETLNLALNSSTRSFKLDDHFSFRTFPEASSQVGTAMPRGRLKSKYQKKALRQEMSLIGKNVLVPLHMTSNHVQLARIARKMNPFLRRLSK